MNVPANLKYSSDHEWCRIEGDTAVIGITDFAQSQLGDIVFVDVPTVGETLAAGEVFGSIEAVKTVSDAFLPVGGEIVEFNEAVDADPAVVNRDAYGEGWLVKVKMSNPAEYDALLGTAAPPAEEMDGVPHHMIAVADPAEQWSAARYAQAAIPIVDDILKRGKLPILVGGTGLWLDAVVQGREFAPGQAGGAVRRELEAQLAAEGMEPLLQELRRVDPESAARLHPADTKRILRALEVYRETGETITAHDERTRSLPPRYDAVWLGLRFADREDMKALIDRRVDAMVRSGLEEEVRALLQSGLPPSATAWQAIGYKEFLGVLEGTATMEQAVAEVKLRSRQYAKRQLTWLRRNPAIHWMEWEKERNFEQALQLSTEILTAAGVC